jgi:hypothetical protein
MPLNDSVSMKVRTGNRYGIISLGCGVSACLLFLCLAYISRLGPLIGGNVLKAIDWMGLVSQKRSYIVEMKPSSIFALNDANAVVWMTWLACVLTITAVSFALLAEYEKELTLYLSVGAVVATTSLGLLSPFGMVMLQAIGVLALCRIRRPNALSALPGSINELESDSLN